MNNPTPRTGTRPRTGRRPGRSAAACALLACLALAWPTSLAQAVAPTTCTPVGPLERLAGAIEVPAALSGQVLTVPAGQTWVHHGALHLEATGRIAVLGTLVALAGPDGAPGDLVLRAPHLLIAGTLRTLSGADAPTLHGTEALVRGADGGDGGAVRLEAPDARVLAGGCIATGDGGDGGSVVQVLRGSSALPADASTTRALAAGAGGNGGDIDFAATPTVLGRFYLGNGGQGGSAIYTGSVPHGVTAVTTQGGAGGLSGFPMLGSARSLVLERALAPALAPASGDGGAGGDARSELPVASRAMGPTDIDGSNGASASQSYGSSCTLGGSDGPNGGNGAPGRDRQLGSNGDPGDPGGRGGDGTPSSAGASASAIAGPGTAGINNGGKGGSAYASGECAGPSGRGGDGGNGGSGGTI
ncbi:MAG: hypothetical protein QOI63_1225, partial [Thermoplasmata archaeon]|nr:hypothetical protein [Thermoplasmata archaeon]